MDTSVLKHRLVAVVNKDLEPGSAMNAVAHMAAGLVARVATNGQGKLASMRFQDYVDADARRYPSISDHPFIVLRGKQGHLRQLVSDAEHLDIPYTVFLNTMTIGGFQEQHEATHNTHTEELVFLGVCLFGLDEQVRVLTKRFSLWR